MINVVIKTEAQAKRVSSEMVRDLKSVLDIYKVYQVVKDKSNNQVIIKSDIECPILTFSVVESALKVINWYMFKYAYINYWIDIEKGTKREYIPVIKVNFMISK